MTEGPMLSLKQAALELYGQSRTIEEQNDKYIKLLLLTDKGLKTHTVHEGGKRKVKVSLADLQMFKEQK